MTEPVVDSALADNTTATQSTISSEGAAAEGAAPASAEALESAPTGSHFYIYDFISFFLLGGQTSEKQISTSTRPACTGAHFIQNTTCWCKTNSRKYKPQKRLKVQ